MLRLGVLMSVCTGLQFIVFCLQILKKGVEFIALLFILKVTDLKEFLLCEFFGVGHFASLLLLKFAQVVH